MKKKPKSKRYADDAPLTKAELATARPMREAFPELVAAYKNGTLRYQGQRGKQKTPTKEQITLRIERDVIAYFKSKGAGWQTRINDALEAFVNVAR